MLSILLGGISNHLELPLFNDIFQNMPDSAIPCVIFSGNGTRLFDWSASLQEGPTIERSISANIPPESHPRPYKGRFQNFAMLAVAQQVNAFLTDSRIYFAHGQFRPSQNEVDIDITEFQSFCLFLPVLTAPFFIVTPFLTREFDAKYPVSIYCNNRSAQSGSINFLLYGCIDYAKESR